MTDKQAAYEAKRRAATGLAAPLAVVTREIHHIGGPAMAYPVTITYRTDMRAEVVAMLELAGMVMANDAGTFW